jgi:hypothetical protein
MYALIISGVAVVFFGGLYAMGVLEARRDLRLRGQWVDPPRPLPRARVLPPRS